MRKLKPSLLAITAALAMPAALTATPQCVPLKPDVWEQTCVADEHKVFSALENSGLTNDWLPSFDASASWLDEMTPLLDFDFDVTGDLQLAPLKFDELQGQSRETPATDADESPQGQS